ncbi:C25 family cysteine peptidase [candidate division CSSED10-310 bacterium]|uniref:C25 family cysteine peptidase n=1 Tax=candidate division CSSED10-310 bacterium TaxID=2855610 RepID=A0ABV6YSB0_UNCC1
MKKLLVAVTLITALGLINRYSFATQDVSQQQYKVTLTHFSFGKVGNKLQLNQVGAFLYEKPGCPAIPRVPSMVEIPFGHCITNFEVTHGKPELFGEKIRLNSVSLPQPLSMTGIKFSARKNQRERDIFSCDDPYPAAHDLVIFAGVQTKQGKSYAFFLTSCFQYQPLSGKLFIIPDISIKMRTRYDAARAPKIRQRKQLNHQIQYLIITSDNLSESFMPFKEWKLKKGLTTEIKTMSWILNSFSGEDPAEKVRNCIIEAYTSWNTRYVLLGGDSNVVPIRQAFAMDCEAGFYADENEIPCDLYFAALDGDWNADGDSTYGEVTDEVDLLPEVYIGRAPVDTVAETTHFVNKIINYEHTPPIGYQTEVVFFSEVLWQDPFTDGAMASDMLADDCFDPRFKPINKYYETSGNLSPTISINALNAGPAIVNHIGHCNYSVIGVDGYLQIDDIDQLMNGKQQFVFNSIGCYPAAFDYDAIGEHFLFNPVGGAIGFIGNSRYGWGSPGNPCYGYSDIFQRRFWYSLLVQNNVELGVALAKSKEYFAAYSTDENVYRWIQYQLNLLGDPELSLWTDIPHYVSVSHPAELPIGNGHCQVAVNLAGQPMEEARVSLMNSSDMYHCGLTDKTGQVAFNYRTTDDRTMFLTVTGPNFLPYEQSIDVVSSGMFLSVVDTKVHDYHEDGLSGNGHAEPGERVRVIIYLKNTGSQPLTALSGELSSTDDFAAIEGNPQTWSDLSPGETVRSTGYFGLTIDPACPVGYVIQLQLTMKVNNVWFKDYTISLPIYGPILHAGRYWTESAVLPDSTVKLGFYCFNTGPVHARNVEATMRTDDPYLDILSPTVFLGTIPPAGWSLPASLFEVSISEQCPDYYETYLNVSLKSETVSNTATLSFIVGQAGFSDNMESDQSKWQIIDDTGHWQRSVYRSYSGDYSWYCGLEPERHYQNQAHENLETVPFNLAPNSTLTFQRWFCLTTYGSDGCYIEIDDGSGYQTLDYIGSGGALANLSIQSDWHMMRYDLSDYSGRVTIRFRFVSDAEDYEEGIYIDDVKIFGEALFHPPPVHTAIP